MPLKQEDDESYHGGPGVSKTTLWALWSKSPFHARFGAKKESAAFDLGRAAHVSILEPETLEARVMKGPDDRRGLKWTSAQDEATATARTLLTASDYDQALLIRDLAATVPELQVMRQGKPIIETSAYTEIDGTLVKTRPDIYSPTHKMMADIKNLTDVSPHAWDRSVDKFGYHVQDALYSDVWERATGMEVEAFFFICFEKSNPPIVQCYELGPATKAEGHAVYQSALASYSECLRTDTWPAYGSGVQTREMSRWGFKLTPPPETQTQPTTGDDE